MQGQEGRKRSLRRGRDEGSKKGKERGREKDVAVKQYNCPQVVYKVVNLNLDNQDLSTLYQNEAGSSLRALAFAVCIFIYILLRMFFPHVICINWFFHLLQALFKCQHLKEAFLDHITSPCCTLPIPLLC